MSTLVTYKEIDGGDVQEVSPDPSAAAGLALNTNFRAIADSLPRNNYGASTNPTPDNDSVDTAGIGVDFGRGSRWYNGTAIFECVDPTPTAAVWVQVNTGGPTPTLDQVLTAGANAEGQSINMNDGSGSGGGALNLDGGVIVAFAATGAPLHAYTLDNLSSGTTTDSGSLDNPATISGNVTLQTTDPPPNHTGYFDFGGGYVTVTDAGMPTGAVTFSFWVRQSSPLSFNTFMFAYGTASGNELFGCGLYNGGMFVTTDDASQNDGQNWSDGDWHFGVVSYDGSGTTTIYKDGVQTLSWSNSLSITLGGTFNIGAMVDDSQVYQGSLADVRVYSGAPISIDPSGNLNLHGNAINMNDGSGSGGGQLSMDGGIILQMRADNQSSAPSSPNPGQIYFDTSSNHFFGWNGTAWVQLDN